MHGGCVEETVYLGGFGGVPVRTLWPTCGGAVSERGAIEVDVKRYHRRVGAGRCEIVVGRITGQFRAFEAFDDGHSVGAGEMVGVAEPCGIGD